MSWSRSELRMAGHSALESLRLTSRLIPVFYTYILESLSKPGELYRGHTHQPKQEMRDGVLYFNPGSAGPRRFKLPVTVGRLRIQGMRIESEVIDLKI